MWWLESTPNTTPSDHATSNNFQTPAGSYSQLPVDASVSSPDIGQKLNTQIERLEALVAEANSRVAVVKRQSAAETEVHSAIVRNLQSKHDEATAAFRKKISELKHSQTEAAKAQKQLNVEFASRHSEYASKIDAAENAARLASEQTDRLRRELRGCLAQLEVQVKLVAHQTTLLNELQSEKSHLQDQLTQATGNCQQIKNELQLKNAALIESNDRIDVLVASQSELQARLQQQQVEHTQQIQAIEQQTYLKAQEVQSQRTLESQAMQLAISRLEQLLEQSVASQNELEVRLQQQQVEHARQTSEIEQKKNLRTQEEQTQHEIDTQALQQTISQLEQSLTQSVAAQNSLQAKLQQQQVEHIRQIAEIEQKSLSTTAQSDLEIKQLRDESLVYRRKSELEIASLKQLVHEFELKQLESQATLECQATKLREQEELLKTAISEREQLATCCHELRVEGQQATEQWQARLHAESETLEAASKQLASLELFHATEIARHELDIRQLSERHQTECDVLRSTISRLSQAHDLLQRDVREQQRGFEKREAEYDRHLQEVEQNSRSIQEHSQQQTLNCKSELDQALAISSAREKQHEDYCAKLHADINSLTQVVADLQSRQTESQAKHASQERLLEQRSAVVESLRIENERLSVLYQEQATAHDQLWDQWKRSIEHESQSRESASALLEVERELRVQLHLQAERISKLHAEAEDLRRTNLQQSQAHYQCAEELRAEITRVQSLMEMQNQQRNDFRIEVDKLRSSLAEAMNAQEVARRNSNDNARSAQKFGAQCLRLREQLQKAAAARRKAESALIRAADLAAPNSVAQVTRREIETHQAVERMVVELKSTRLVCLNLKRQSSDYKKEIERLKSELHSMNSPN